MKVKVIKEFVDKHTRKLHKVNDTFECDKNRFNEIKSAGNYVEEVTAKAEPAKEQK